MKLLEFITPTRHAILLEAPESEAVRQGLTLIRTNMRTEVERVFEQEIGARYGGLMSYGPDFSDIFRRAGVYAGRVLKGANPAELAIEEPRQFRMVLNLKTARELGITIPPAVRLRADEVIE